MQRKNLQQFESSLAKAMLEEMIAHARAYQTLPETKKTQPANIFKNLLEIAIILHREIFQIIKQAILSTPETAPLSSGLQTTLTAWAIKHSSGDAAIGALLPEHSYEHLHGTVEGRRLLLDAIENMLLGRRRINTIQDMLAFIKTIDDMCYAYEFAIPNKRALHEYEAIRQMIFPNTEESEMRSLRKDAMAVSYGVSTREGDDLVPKSEKQAGFFPGKAKFVMLPAEERFRQMLQKFDDAKLPTHAKQLDYYKIPHDPSKRNPTEKYASRYRPWFEKLVKMNQEGELPLIASVSASSSRVLIATLHLGCFMNDGVFNLDKALFLANSLMGYFVFCGHHSVTEVMEVWNRLLDYVAINHPKLLSRMLPENPDLKTPYSKTVTAEQRLLYGHIGDYHSFLHRNYAEKLMNIAAKHILSYSSWVYFHSKSGGSIHTAGNEKVKSENPHPASAYECIEDENTLRRPNRLVQGR